MGPRSLARVYDIIDLFLSVYIEMLTQWIKIKLCSTLSFVMGPFLAPRRELSAPWMARRDGERNSLLPKTNKVKGKKRCWKMMDGSTCSASGASSLMASLLFFLLFLFFLPFGSVNVPAALCDQECTECGCRVPRWAPVHLISTIPAQNEKNKGEVLSYWQCHLVLHPKGQGKDAPCKWCTLKFRLQPRRTLLVPTSPPAYGSLWNMGHPPLTCWRSAL